MNYVGIDHHRQYSHMTLMDEEGQTIRSGRVPNLRAEIEKFLEGSEAVEAAIETGRSSYTMVDVLEEMGVAVKIAHPNEVKAIARAKIKTDKRDSEVLAHLLRMNMIPEVYRRSVEAVWPSIRADFDLRYFFERLARGKDANKAKVATARRLLTIIYKVLKEGRNYIAYRR